MPDEAPLAWDAQDEEDDPYLMANLYPRTTGLPMTIWVSERGGARHDVRLKVSTVHGARAIRKEEQAVVALRPQPRLLHGALDRGDLDAVLSWISLNQAVVIEYCNGEADTAELIGRLKPLPG